LSMVIQLPSLKSIYLGSYLVACISEVREMGSTGTPIGASGGMGSREPCADGCLLRELVNGSEDAFSTLYDRYSASIFATAQRASRDRSVAADVVQETFLTLWNRAEQFDPSRGSLIAWLSTIARNRTVDHLRAAGRRPAPAPISAFTWADGTDGATLDWLERSGEFLGGAVPDLEPETALSSKETREAIAVGLAALAPPEREVILLAYQEGLSQSEIAARLGWPIGTVKTRTRRAHRQLREVLDRSALLPERGGSASDVSVPSAMPRSRAAAS
jgi:RNA polymerase sigma-70 factor, ECF subfamily